MKLGLFRIEQLLSQMGNPHLGVKFFHVTGSNGKGSVTTFLEYLTHEHGKSVTGYYSPHLSTILERFKYNTVPIDETLFVDALEVVRPHAERLDQFGPEFSPSFFEFVTAMYFYITKKLGAEFGSVEVGLGGRFDATNVLTPEVSVITTISLEHTNVLGDTVEQIAFEKAGIVKPGKPVVIGQMPEGAKNVIKQIAQERGSKVYEYGKDFVAEVVKLDFNKNIYNYYGDTKIENIPVKLNGKHQLYNVAVALKAFELVLKPDEDAVRSAFEKAFIPGRFEEIEGIIFDGAHNPQAAEAFVENLDLYFPNKTRAVLFGILDDKDKENVLRFIGPRCQAMIVTRPPSKRAMKVEETFEIAKRYCQKVILEPDPLKAVEILKNSEAEVKFVTGSFYLVGLLRSYVMNGKVSEELILGGA
ncbi:bifunctional folylpolyglutamate synthase/dihydrofolate synthase [Fervidobacterium thailandense]|uniref:tetrahydrofolate synthase n=2 Tax=Fervidobacterium thailandense TaxID=1008305 RepID=A0A1E3G3E4_9BACT|nr:bifunctional folylpolyglutamate synthase/dihydrofolate synthase [Fervidobacterium thailandense]